ncbi:MAG: class I SAM-dependent methyltransferase [Chloroflexi bacterium]|nr:class I SAM-dependent methyltransferase [Chloroflexota bacterium]
MTRLREISSAGRLVPFTAVNTVWRRLDKEAGSILDVGCGRRSVLRFFPGPFHTVGVDIFEPYLREAVEARTHDNYVRCDVRRLPFRRKTFDVVICLEVLEHLDREDGCQLLSDLEETARRQVIVSTPLGKYDQEAYDDNPAQLHRYLWSPQEMKEKGYRVVTLGLRNLGGDSGLASRLPAALHLLSDGVWVLAGPFTRFLPRWAGEMVAVKNLVGPKSAAS